MPVENIYEALRASHELQRSLCRKMLRAPVEGDRRQEVYEALKVELAAHAAAEERFLYAPMLMDDMGLSPSRHALAEHHELDELVETLGETDTDSEDWLDKARALSHEVHHHLREEEKKFFQISGKILTDTQKSRLGKQYLKDYMRMKAKLSGD